MAIRFSGHAVRRMDQQGITRPDVLEVFRTGRTIEDYPDDKPYPSRLVLAWVAGRPLHVVAATAAEETVIVTAYQPDPERWDETFSVRRPR
jgi:hypothetical protein